VFSVFPCSRYCDAAIGRASFCCEYLKGGVHGISFCNQLSPFLCTSPAGGVGLLRTAMGEVRCSHAVVTPGRRTARKVDVRGRIVRLEGSLLFLLEVLFPSVVPVIVRGRST
jgi:hypothetical protein